MHHPIWDYDLSSAPILADINVDGKAIKAVALPSKEAFLYVFDRVTGEPVWPIEERPVPQSDVPGEKTSPTQPFPTKPPAYARNFLKVPDDLIDFTPEMRAQAKDAVARYKTGPMFLPPVVGDPKGISGRDESRQRQRRHQLAGRGLRSGNAHRVRAGQSIGRLLPFRCARRPRDFRTFATSWDGTIRNFGFPKGLDSAARRCSAAPRRLPAASGDGSSAGRRRVSRSRVCRSSNRRTA